MSAGQTEGFPDGANRRAMASMIDVAARAGLSIASVSRVLNDSEPTSADTRERVLRAASELDYSIDRRARALRMQKSDTIGLIAADAKNPFFTEIIAAIEAAAYDAKHDLFFANSDEDLARERLHLQSMVAQRIGGVIILPVGSDAAGLAPFVERAPLVCLDRRLPGLRADVAIVDNELGSELAVEHLCAAGHERIGIVVAHHRTVSVERVRGFRRALAARGIRERPGYVQTGENARSEAGYACTRRLLEQGEPPTAIFVTNHLLTLGALYALRDAGLRVPHDVSVVSFDDTQYAALLDPPLTTIAQPTEALGHDAVRLLLDRVDRGYEGEPRSIVLPPSLHERRSVRTIGASIRRHNEACSATA